MAKITHSDKPFEGLDLNRPFLGLRSFEEKNKSQFGGRDQEIDDLYDLVEDNYLTVVFGDSGIGKTSLLKAGLMPRLRQNFYYPIYIRIDFFTKKSPLNQLRDHVYGEMKALDASIGKMESETLWEYLHDVKLLNGLVTPVLILDQFEEIFTLGKSNKHIKEFVGELGDLAQNRIPASVKIKYKKQGKTVPSRYSKQNYHIVLSLREDYLARLDELKSHIPSIMNNSFRVVQMTISQALEAAIKPGKGLIDEPIAIEIIKKLPGVSQSDFDLLNNKGDNTKALKVEPFLLSLICDRLNERRIEKGLNKFDKDIVDEFNVDDVIKSFYNDTLQKFDSNVELAIENLLLDDDGFRKLQPLKEFQSEYDISDDVIVKLVNSRIVRQENRNNVDYLELIHDVLKDVIKKKREKREKIELYKAERQEREKKEREKEARLKKIIKRIVIAVVIVLLGVVGSYLYIWNEAKQKQNEFWDIAKKIPSEKGFEAYLKDYPKGRFEQEALKAIDTFYLNKAINDTTPQRINLFKKYLSETKKLNESYGYVIVNEEAINDTIKKIDQENNRESILDKKAWEKANTTLRTFAGYLNYIKNPSYQKKQHINEAVAKIKELGRTGLLYSGRISGGRVRDAVFEYVWRPDNSKVMPAIGDIVKARQSRNTYILSTSLRRSRSPWLGGENAYVLGVLINYETLFLQIVYEKYNN